MGAGTPRIYWHMNRLHLYHLDEACRLMPLCGHHHKLPVRYAVVIDEVTCKRCRAAYFKEPLWEPRLRRKHGRP